MIYVALTFLFLSIYFYLIFGGADFGVGVLELFSNSKNRHITKDVAYRVMGPVWEANHIWVIISIVILWVCFPNYYYVMTTQLHIPLTLLLIGIIARGTSFVFRHYDAYKGDEHKIYDKVFQYSSIFSMFLIGINAGALLSGNLVHPDHISGKGFVELYISGWFNWFSLFVGVFIVSMSAFISSVFLVGETQGEQRFYYLRKARNSNVFVVISGSLVFIESLISQRQFSDLVFSNPWSITAILIVTLLLVPLWKSLRNSRKLLSRFIVSLQVLLILFAWGAVAFPNVIFTQNSGISILENTAEPIVFYYMGLALIFAAIFVLPGLYHLFKTFGLINEK